VGNVTRVFSLQIMDRLDLSVFVEQVNPEVDNTILDKWQENEELALNNVVDPNTEFKVIIILFVCSCQYLVV